MDAKRESCCLKRIEFYLAGAFLRLIHVKEDEFPELNTNHHLKSIRLKGKTADQSWRNCLRPSGCLDDKRRFLGIPWIRLGSVILASLVAAYLVAKYTVLTFRRYWHDSVLIELKVPQFKPPDCLAAEWDLDKARKLELEDRALGWPLNDPFKFILGSPVTLYTYVASACLFVFLVAFFKVNFGLIKVDAVGFLFDPEAQRLRMRLLLRRQLVSLGESIDNHVKIRDAQSKGLALCDDRKFSLKSLNLDKEQQPADRFAELVLELQTTNTKQNAFSDERRRLFRIMGKIWRLDLVKPANLESQWHRSQMKRADIYLKLSHLCITTWFVTMLVFYVISELASRTNYRLNLMDCYKNMSIPVLRPDFEPIASQSDYMLFKSYDGSIVKFIKIMFMVEGKYYLAKDKLLSLAEIVMVCFLSSFWFTAYSFLFFISFLDRNRWLNQIRGQLDRCVVRASFQEKDETEDEVLEDVMVLYLNYSLFKSQFTQFQTYSGMHLSQIISMVAVLMVGNHYVTTYELTDSTVKFMHLFSVVVLFLLIDIYLFSVSYIYNNLTHLVKKFNKLLAIGASGSTRMRSLVAMWRRHQLDDEELNQFYALSYLSMSCICFDIVVKFNIYLVAFWMTVTKLI